MTCITSRDIYARVSAPRPTLDGTAMTSQIRAEAIDAIQWTLRRAEYAISGDAALAAHGSGRSVSVIDVVVPEKTVALVEGQLLSYHRMKRTQQNRIGYMASNGRCYGINIASDRDFGQPFLASRDAQRTPGSNVRVVTLPFLLSAKLRAWMTAAQRPGETGGDDDAADIRFIVGELGRQKVKLGKNTCQSVAEYGFLAEFYAEYPAMVDGFQAVGLERRPRSSASLRSWSSRDSGSTRSGRGVCADEGDVKDSGRRKSITRFLRRPARPTHARPLTGSSP